MPAPAAELAAALVAAGVAAVLAAADAAVVAAAAGVSYWRLVAAAWTCQEQAAVQCGAAACLLD